MSSVVERAREEGSMEVTGGSFLYLPLSRGVTGGSFPYAPLSRGVTGESFPYAPLGGDVTGEGDEGSVRRGQLSCRRRERRERLGLKRED